MLSAPNAPNFCKMKYQYFLQEWGVVGTKRTNIMRLFDEIPAKGEIEVIHLVVFRIYSLIAKKS